MSVVEEAKSFVNFRATKSKGIKWTGLVALKKR